LLPAAVTLVTHRCVAHLYVRLSVDHGRLTIDDGLWSIVKC